MDNLLIGHNYLFLASQVQTSYKYKKNVWRELYMTTAQVDGNIVHQNIARIKKSLELPKW